MKNQVLLLVILSILSFHDVLGKKTELVFGEDGKFKIVQFTDIHMRSRDPKSMRAIEAMNNVLDAEKPDLVVFTGDIVWGKPADSSFLMALQPTIERNIPFFVTFGNHDYEQGLTKKQLLDLIKKVDCNLTNTVKGLSGESNAVLEIKHNETDKLAAVLYCFDSHAYSKIKGIGGYDYIKHDQINWYLEKSQRYADRNGLLPTLLFCHIPIPEYAQAKNKKKTVVFGNKAEGECAPALNSGLFSAMKQQGDVLGMFVGHDHNNDYILNWHGIALSYGRFTGGNTVYNDLPDNGARVIELTQGERSFKSWVRLRSGDVEQKTQFPNDFVEKK